MALLAIGIAAAAAGIATLGVACIIDEYIARREVRKAREGYEARRRIARGE